jgi:hypothetical protein
MQEIHHFLTRLFAPRLRRPLIVDGVPLGRELGLTWRTAVEYRLAELGGGLRPEVAIRGLPTAAPERPGRLVFQGDVLFIHGSAVEDKRLRPEELALDLPHALIDRPAVTKGDTPEAKIAGRLTAALLTMRRLLDPSELLPVDSSFVAEVRQPPQALLTWIAAAVVPVAHTPVKELLRNLRPEVLAHAQGLIEMAWQSARAQDQRCVRHGNVSALWAGARDEL